MCYFPRRRSSFGNPWTCWGWTSTQPVAVLTEPRPDATARVGLLRVSRVPSAAGRAGSWAPGRRPAPAPSGRPPEAGVLPSSRQGRVTPPIRPADVQREETGTADALPGGRCEPLTPVPAPCPWHLPLTPAGLTATYANEAHGSRVVVAEWLRRWTRNPLGSPRAGSNPADYGAPPPTWGPSYCRRLSREGSATRFFLGRRQDSALARTGGAVFPCTFAQVTRPQSCRCVPVPEEEPGFAMLPCPPRSQPRSDGSVSAREVAAGSAGGFSPSRGRW